MGYDMAHVFLDKLEDMLLFLVPNYVLEGKESAGSSHRLYRRQAPFCDTGK